MEMICRSCIALKYGLRMNKNQLSKFQSSLTVIPFLSSRSYATKDRTSEKKYKHGKLIVEKFEDPTIYPSFLMTLSGTDEVVLDSYLHQVRKAAKMVDVNLVKSFNMPAIEETHKAKREGKGLVSEIVYHLKKYQRVAEVRELTGEKSDIFLEYIQEAMPAGVQVEIELQRWEKMVEPNHIMFRDENN